jgi:hypothetical protein
MSNKPFQGSPSTCLLARRFFDTLHPPWPSKEDTTQVISSWGSAWLARRVQGICLTRVESFPTIWPQHDCPVTTCDPRPHDALTAPNHRLRYCKRTWTISGTLGGSDIQVMLAGNGGFATRCMNINNVRMGFSRKSMTWSALLQIEGRALSMSQPRTNPVKIPFMKLGS